MAGPVTYVELGTGLHDAVRAAGHWLAQVNGTWQADNPAAVQVIINSYAGSATELAWWQGKRQADLDALFDANFDLPKFIRGGTLTTITATQVGNFLATITDNYRVLRASISAAATVAAVQAININTGWPSNP